MSHFRRPAAAALSLSLFMGSLAFQQADAAQTEISTVPVAGVGQVAPKPNIMLLMDTSRSMAFTHMPDEVEAQRASMSVGYRSAQCNTLYYDPAKQYSLPKRSDGSNWPTPEFIKSSALGGARYDAYSATDLSTVDLSTAFRAYDKKTRQIVYASGGEDTPQPAYYYQFTDAAGKSLPLDYAAAPCTDQEADLFPANANFTGTVSAPSTGGTWKRKQVTSSSGTGPAGLDERQNFAIWYTYYRTRMALVKSSIGLAFNPLTDRFRLGFISMSPMNDIADLGKGINATKYLNIDEFKDQHRIDWFDKLNAQAPEGNSPAREGLARVGRHYAGKQDSINTGMTQDPVLYSCQQNFTIMTTDGYWNTSGESKGPVGLDGVTKVGQQDGMLTPEGFTEGEARFDPTMYSQRPIWDGATSGRQAQTDKTELNRLVACLTGSFYKRTQVTRQSTVQTVSRTQSLTVTTQQALASTSQTSRSTTQATQTTTTETKQTLQTLASTQQTTRSTRQELQTTSWTGQSSRTVTQSTTQNLQTTRYTEKAQTRREQQTVQTTEAKSQMMRSTSEQQRSTSQQRASTSQLRRTDSQMYRSTSQPTRSTSTQQATTTRRFQRTSQQLAYNGKTEQTTPVASCTPSADITCVTLVTGPTAVASCTPESATQANDYTARTCDTPTVNGPTPVAACTPASADSSNSFTQTTCGTSTTGPTPVASCTPQPASSSNNYATVTCASNTTGPTLVASCSAGTDASFVTTTCAPQASTPVGVASCTPASASASNNYTSSSCGTATTTNVPVASCTPASADASNNWTTTTCNTASTGPTGVASCTASGPTSANSWTDTTCNTVTTGPTAVASCTAGTSGTVVTTCTPNNVQSATPVQSCTGASPTTNNGFTTTSCNTSTSAWTVNGSCTAIAASSTNGWTTTNCRDNQVMAPTPVLPANCSAGTSNAVTTTCTPVEQKDVPVASCVPNSSGPSFVTCSTNNTGPTRVASCTQGGGANTNFVYTTCQTTDSAQTNVQSCTAQAAGAGNNNTATVCTPYSNTVGVQPGSCNAQTAKASNNWVTISCPADSTTGPTPVALNSCTPVAPSSANQWIRTTCANNGPTTPTPVQTCTSGTGANFVVTTCSRNDSAVAAVDPGSCNAVTASSNNNWTSTVCKPTVTTIGVKPGTCDAQDAKKNNNYTQITCNTVKTGPTFVAAGSCTPGTDNNYMTTTCDTQNTGPTPVASCTPGTDGSFKTTTCSSNNSGPTQLAYGSACTNQTASSGNGWTTRTCTSSNTTTAGSCTPSAPGVLPKVTCETVSTGPTAVASCSKAQDSDSFQTTCSTEDSTELVSSCTDMSAGASNGYTSVSCQAIAGQKIQTKTRFARTTYSMSGSTQIAGTGVADPVQESDWTDQGNVCYVDRSKMPVVDLGTDWKRSTTGMTSGCTAWPCKEKLDTSTAIEGSINSLADVAQYYYITDLRTQVTSPVDKSKNDVPKLGSGAEDDRAPWQHMTTFVLGLGVSGNINYRSDYKSAVSGDFSRIRDYQQKDPLNWPVWPTSANLNQLEYNDKRSIDDYWHTAVNGRGKYFSAKDPDSVVQGLREALAGINAQAGAGAGAATSSLTPVAGDNSAYTGSFTSSEWTGELTAQDIDLKTGNLAPTVRWSARSLLDRATADRCDNRTIFTRDPASNAQVDFTWNTFSCGSNALAGQPQGAGRTTLPASLQAYFNDASKIVGLAQYPSMTNGDGGTVDQRNAARGANLVNYLRGQRGAEGFLSNSDKLYRTRSHVLGDIVNSQPIYVRAPNLNYQDAGYDTFKTSRATRTPMVYVGGNDGMLHAFYAPAKDTDPNYAKAGQEAWAYIPSMVLPELWRLADTNYGEKHRFSVDGSPVSGDVKDPSTNTWKTMLVGGLAGGGAGYYALDVTDPASPKVMWEFTQGACAGNPAGAKADCNLGLSFGRPIITKLKSGKWVVLVTSGYNNTTASGSDGRGYLYVLDAMTGQIVSRIATDAGSSGSPSGLREINSYVNNIVYDNTAQRVYGADIQGNIWRFDINDNIAPAGLEATRLGTALDAAGNPQPITTRPELAEVSGSTMVLVATGKLLSTLDLTDGSQQSVYGIKDPLSATSPVYANLRTTLKHLTMKQVGSGAGARRTISCDAASVTDCSSTAGWFIDLPDGGERVNVDMQTVLGTLVFATNVPSDTMCAAGGYSWLNYVNLINGEAVATSDGGTVSVPFFSDSVVVGLGLVGLPDGTIWALGRDATGSTKTLRVPVGSPPPQGKRISWREIVQ